MPYEVTLSSVGNPDNRQNSERPLPGVPNQIISVLGFREASEACRRYIETHNLGGGNWAGGTIRDESGAAVGRVSYNGRVWAAGNSGIMDAKLVYDPFPSRKPEVDPLVYEDATLDVPGYGKVVVKAGMTVTKADGVKEMTGMVHSAPREFVVGESSCEFSAQVFFSEAGRPSMIRGRFVPMKGGDYRRTVPVTDSLWTALTSTVIDYLESPEGRAMTLRNQIKHCMKHIESYNNTIENMRQNIREAEEKILEFQEMITDTHARLVAIEDEATPSP